jgi:hypothetical protein
MHRRDEDDAPFQRALQTRREALQKMGGTALFLMSAGAAWGAASPAELRAEQQPFFKLSASEARTLEVLGGTLVPGADKAGIAHYVDRQLDSQHPLLMLRYLDFPGALLDFYQTGIESFERYAEARFEAPLDALPATSRTELVRAISQANPEGWSGPPAPLFYFVVRNDAMDVYYGTPEGFERLGIPYMPHITPTQPW